MFFLLFFILFHWYAYESEWSLRIGELECKVKRKLLKQKNRLIKFKFLKELREKFYYFVYISKLLGVNNKILLREALNFKYHNVLKRFLLSALCTRELQRSEQPAGIITQYLLRYNTLLLATISFFLLLRLGNQILFSLFFQQFIQSLLA